MIKDFISVRFKSERLITHDHLIFAIKLSDPFLEVFLKTKINGIRLFELETRKRYKKIQNADIFPDFIHP